ncbi:MAG: alpha/beta-hydrolase family protein [Nocardioides sp.]|uniref:alpha/beta-hydrolase family protein n=1 Tax=Nocardioides sp. TaxID=35761 RepID=UPI003F0E3385
MVHPLLARVDTLVDEARRRTPARLVAVLSRPHVTGVVLAAWMFGQSLQPMLLLRSWLFQGVLAGVAITLGYWVGTGLRNLVAWVASRTDRGWRPSAQVLDRWRAAGWVAAVLYALSSIATAVGDHEWTWQRLGHEPTSFWYVYIGTLVVAALVAGLLFSVGWGLRWVWLRLAGAGARLLPAWIAAGLALVLLTWAVVASLSNVVMDRTLDGFNSTFAAGDRDLDGAPEQPTSSVRSGGPGSEVDWAKTGREGRRFLTRGPSVEEIADFATDEVSEPVRVFVGRAQADTVDERVALAVDELERFGGFEREVLLVVVPTGTGWINEQIVQPLEYFHGGDVATVAVQYSHLPSPLAFLSEADAAGDTGTALVAAVEEKLATLDDPPTLYVAGESLGSFGGARAFSSLDDSAARTAGALWIGPPETMHLRREAERVRQPGSTQVRPVVGDGGEFVFINRASDFDDLDPARAPHSVFLQQADDPIVWWDWETAYSRPDWLREPLDPAVNPEVGWSPVTTFLQLAVDMGVSNDFDAEHGHLYGTLPLTSWYAIDRPGGWDAVKVEELRNRLETVRR